nr:MAG TPA: hypothetical protein [Caudoviricetes sp.]
MCALVTLVTFVHLFSFWSNQETYNPHFCAPCRR